MDQNATQPGGVLERLEDTLQQQAQYAAWLGNALRRMDPSAVSRTSGDIDMALRLQREVRLHLETIKRATTLIQSNQIQINAALTRIAACLRSSGRGG